MNRETMLREAESIQLNIGEILKVLRGEPTHYTEYELEMLCNAICNAAEIMLGEVVGTQHHPNTMGRERA
jgi:hypothetical protein